MFGNDQILDITILKSTEYYEIDIVEFYMFGPTVFRQLYNVVVTDYSYRRFRKFYMYDSAFVQANVDGIKIKAGFNKNAPGIQLSSTISYIILHFAGSVIIFGIFYSVFRSAHTYGCLAAGGDDLVAQEKYSFAFDHEISIFYGKKSQGSIDFLYYSEESRLTNPDGDGKYKLFYYRTEDFIERGPRPELDEVFYAEDLDLLFTPGCIYPHAGDINTREVDIEQNQIEKEHSGFYVGEGNQASYDAFGGENAAFFLESYKKRIIGEKERELELQKQKENLFKIGFDSCENLLEKNAKNIINEHKI